MPWKKYNMDSYTVIPHLNDPIGSEYLVNKRESNLHRRNIINGGYVLAHEI